MIGLIGYPVEHSLSPAMHNAAFAALGLNYRYLPLPVRAEYLEEAMAGLRALGFVGANVTVPHKEAVMGYLDEVSPEARAIGAVNTIVLKEERLVGHNTDGLGFIAALREGGFRIRGRRAIVLGAGGAARAVVYALVTAGAEVVVFNRTLSRAKALAHSLSPHLPPTHAIIVLPLIKEALAQHASSAHLLVNATPLGMWPEVETSPWPERLPFPPHLTVFDLVYNPRKTALLRVAQAAGAKAISGLGMLVHQGAEAFCLWTGEDPPIEVMYQAAIEGLR